MTDQVQDRPGEPDKPQPSQGPITLTIRIMPDLSCQVDGPISDLILSYGMLEAARDIIYGYQLKKHQAKSNGSGIIDFARRFKR